MDQPTKLQITITGNSNDVKRAALAAQRRVDLYTAGFDEKAYVFGDGSDFEEKMDDTVVVYDYTENEDGTAEYDADQESYACIEENDIVDIANEIVKTSPDVEFHISAVITVTYADGFDLCVDVDYVDGTMSVETREDYYEDFFEDEDEDGFDDDEE